ncbi:MAG: hypothetical protein ABIG95_03200 [Candidatus Woesearchaeota archaeon]
MSIFGGQCNPGNLSDVVEEPTESGILARLTRSLSYSASAVFPFTKAVLRLREAGQDIPLSYILYDVFRWDKCATLLVTDAVKSIVPFSKLLSSLQGTRESYSKGDILLDLVKVGYIVDWALTTVVRKRPIEFSSRTIVDMITYAMVCLPTYWELLEERWGFAEYLNDLQQKTELSLGERFTLGINAICQNKEQMAAFGCVWILEGLTALYSFHRQKGGGDIRLKGLVNITSPQHFLAGFTASRIALNYLGASDTSASAFEKNMNALNFVLLMSNSWESFEVAIGVPITWDTLGDMLITPAGAMCGINRETSGFIKEYFTNMLTYARTYWNTFCNLD